MRRYPLLLLAIFLTFVAVELTAAQSTRPRRVKPPETLLGPEPTPAPATNKNAPLLDVKPTKPVGAAQVSTDTTHAYQLFQQKQDAAAAKEAKAIAAADPLNGIEGRTKSVAASDLQLGDIVRWADAKNNPKHFASFIFKDDKDHPVVFSKSGTKGPFEYATTTDPRWAAYGYGTIKGINKGETGYYHPR